MDCSKISKKEVIEASHKVSFITAEIDDSLEEFVKGDVNLKLFMMSLIIQDMINSISFIASGEWTLNKQILDIINPIGNW